MTVFDCTLCDLTVEVFCRVDDAMPEVQKHPLSLLHPSEVVTLGLLYALRGGSFRRFERWARRELSSLFPRLPHRTRLHRLLCAHAHHTQRFLATPTVFGVLDSYGIELVHPRRFHATPHRFARRGLSNKRWILGAKVAVCINCWGHIVSWQVASANTSDLHFLPLAHDLSGHSILLADRGFWLSRKPKKAYLHKRMGRKHPDNVMIHQHNQLITPPNQWAGRRLIETVFGLLTQVFGLKHLTQRKQHAVEAKVAFAMAAYNLCVQWSGKTSLKIAHFAL